MQSSIPVAVVGASGYAGEELVRLILGHPHTDLVGITSRQYAGQTLAQVFPKFAHYPKAKTIRFNEPNAEIIARDAEVVFLALPHGVAAEYAVPLLELGCKVIDLSADFRLRKADTYKDFYGHEHPAPALLDKAVYGLPEVYRDTIRNATLLACPGCYPTSILVPTLPLLAAKLVHPQSIIADCLSGVTGAGRKVELDYLFAECNESIRPYGVPKHRHLSELEQEMSVAAAETVTIQFSPHLIPVNRGILSTIYMDLIGDVRSESGRASLPELSARITACYQQAYGSEPFVRLLEGKALPDTKNVVGTNFVELAWRIDPRTNRLIVMSAEDNIIKGTSGQAIQCFNIMSGFTETAGLY